MELHNCYDSITPVERLGIETSLSWYNHREDAQLIGSVIIYVNNNVNIYDLNIDVTGSFSNEICDENTCYPGLMCTMDDNVLFSNGSIKNGYNVEGGNVFVRACNLTLENSDVFNGLSERGAGVYVEFGSLALQKSYITGNQATQGGGIYKRRNIDRRLHPHQLQPRTRRRWNLCQRTELNHLYCCKATRPNVVVLDGLWMVQVD